MDRKQFVTENIETMIDDLGGLVEIPSVLDPDTVAPGRPFGRDVGLALERFLQLAARMGMETVNYDGYAGEVTLGHGDYMVGILCHIDVVAAGPGWDTPPFQMIRKDGRLCGRGTSDDKGPLISSLYAMKYIRDQKLLPQGCSIRLIVGADEEEELRCIDYYVKHAPRLPDASFVPDGYFPLVNCEKGLIDFDLIFSVRERPGAAARILSLTGGTGRNLTAASAQCQLAVCQAEREAVCARLKQVPDLAVRPIPEGFAVEAEGVAVHAMQPEKGKNAINLLLHGLEKSGVSFVQQDFLDAFEKAIGTDLNGQRLGCDFRDARSGILTLNVGMIELANGQVLLKANTRYPASLSYDQIRTSLIAGLEQAGFEYRECLSIPPLDISRDAPLIQKLMESYQEVTGDQKHDAFSIGGATYARSIPNAVSFGPLFPGEIELAHEANECLSIQSLERMTEIYISALEKLLN